MEKRAIEGGTPVRPKEHFLVFGAPVITDEDIEAVVGCLKRRWIGTGPKVSEFEAVFSKFKKAGHAVALSSGTAALHLSLLAAGIGPGDEVITTPMTFCATINAIIHCGATPVLADCDRHTMNINPEAVADAVSSRTKAILPVHFAGRCCEMEEIMNVARSENLLVIEDCAHAVESEYHGRSAGTFGNAGCFSFYATKNVVTGEGGMVITDDHALAQKIKVLALHGMSHDAWDRFSDQGYKHYQVVQCGYKYNMMDIQAAMGIHQLARVNRLWERRRVIWNTYNAAFCGLPCTPPPDPEPNTRHACHLYTPVIDIEKTGKSRDWVLEALTAENIGVGAHYIPVHLHPFYSRTYGWQKGDFPNAEWVGERTLSLPLSAGLTDKDVQDVIDAFVKVLTF